MDKTAELAAQIDRARWDWLKAHNERGGLIIVDRTLDLAEVGERLAADDAALVGRWMASRLLSKPAAEDIAGWNGAPDREFRVLIISPFVLMQELD